MIACRFSTPKLSVLVQGSISMLTLNVEFVNSASTQQVTLLQLVSSSQNRGKEDKADTLLLSTHSEN